MADEAPPAEAAIQEPAPATEPATPTPVAEPAAAETTPPPESPRKIEGEIGGGVEGYMAAKGKALNPPLKSEAPPVETAPAPETPVEEPAPAAEPAPASEPAPTPPVEPAPPVVEDEEKTPERIRLSGLPDGHLVAAANRIAREEGIPFKDAFRRVAGLDSAPPPAEPAPPASTLRSRADIDADLVAARTERKEAAAAADRLEAGAATRMLEAEEKIETLRGEMGELEQAEAQAEAERQNREQNEFTGKVSESQTLAVKYWPESGKKDSELSKLMVELADQYEKDPKLAPLTWDADAPFYFAKLAAKQLGLLPVHLRTNGATPPVPAPTPKPSTPPAIKPPTINQRAVIRPMQPAATPASGAARTTQEPNVDPLGIEKIRNVADYEAVKQKAGLRR